MEKNIYTYKDGRKVNLHKCKYDNCNVATGKENAFCIFHEPKKWISNEEFNDVFLRHIKEGHTNCTGFIFPSDIELNKLKINNSLILSKSTCYGKFEIKDCLINGQLEIKDADFKDIFRVNNLNSEEVTNELEDDLSERKSHSNYKCAIFLERTKFNGSLAISNSFIEGNFNLSNVKITNKSKPTNVNGIINGNTINYLIHLNNITIDIPFQFLNNKINHSFYAINATFNSSISFSGTKFKNMVSFGGASFNGGVEFKNSDFVVNQGWVHFGNCKISKEIIFENNNINCGIVIEDIELSDISKFTINSPNFIEKDNKIGSFDIKNIDFSLIKATFKNINSKTSLLEAIVNFEKCILYNSYFEECNFNYISLFTSKFENSNFLNCDWGNNNIYCIYEEKYYFQKEKVKLSKPLDDKFKSLTLIEISSLYNQFKNYFDKIRRYDVSSFFYRKELDIKRLNFKSKDKKMYYLYSLYKTFTSYGTKPKYLAKVQFILTSIFILINLLNGLQINIGNKIQTINYDINLLNYNIVFKGNFWNDLSYSLIYSLNRIIPFNVTNFTDTKIVATNISLWYYVISFFYSILSAIVIYSFVISLRRHFKRF